MSITDTPTEKLKQANQEANETRIKLNTLRACYVNLASTFHIIEKLNQPAEHDLDWTKCINKACQANYEVLIHLGLQ